MAVGIAGVYTLAETFGPRATARTLIGYANETGVIHFFEGSISGTVVSPHGAGGFGWDALFQPDGQKKTFAEMQPEEKRQYSMRNMAIHQLCTFLTEPLQVATLRNTISD